MLRIYNSLTRQKEMFIPIEQGKVMLYVCGMTVYDLCHIGHARVMVVFDLVTRYLRASGYQVTYVRNITDIDDKIIIRAQQNNESVHSLTKRFITEMNHDATALNVLPPDKEPKATESMDAIISMIRTLLTKDIAYIADNGDIYYDVSKFSDYGKLSGRHIDELRSGERIAVNEAKHDPLDFVLWKAAKAHEPAWGSPWGPGRPGWHIECSAMSATCLGEHFDIHGGGQDLQFPHHENEIAQSESVHDCKSVNYWMHNGFVHVDDEKMSKSLDNFFTVREVLQRYPAEVVRYFIITSHYRSPLNYADDRLAQAKAALTRLYTALRNIHPQTDIAWQNDKEFGHGFSQAMDDDFNTPLALSILADVRQALNKQDVRSERACYLAGLLRSLGGVLGLLQQQPDDFLLNNNNDNVAEITALIDKRNLARSQKNWEVADEVRNQLNKMGIIIEDTASKTTWRKS